MNCRFPVRRLSRGRWSRVDSVDDYTSRLLDFKELVERIMALGEAR
jgi:hypothetical protein